MCPIQSGRPRPRRENQLGAPFVEPRGRHRPVELLSASAVRPRESSASAKMISESTVISGWARAIRCCCEELVVVRDDPVVDPHHGAVTDRGDCWLRDSGALGEVADVDEELRRILGHADPLEQGALPLSAACARRSALQGCGRRSPRRQRLAPRFRSGGRAPRQSARRSSRGRGYIRRFRTKCLKKAKRPCGRPILLDASAGVLVSCYPSREG